METALALLVLVLSGSPARADQRTDHKAFVLLQLLNIISRPETPFDRVPMREELNEALNTRIRNVEPKATQGQMLLELVDVMLEDPTWMASDRMVKTSQNLIWYILNTENAENELLLAHFQFGLRKLISDIATSLKQRSGSLNVSEEQYNRLEAILSQHNHIKERRADLTAEMPRGERWKRSAQVGLQFCQMVLSKPYRIQL